MWAIALELMYSVGPKILNRGTVYTILRRHEQMKLSDIELSDVVGILTFGMAAILFWKFILSPM